MTNDTYQVCIVGSGAAGGILAHQLAKSGIKVVTLEQGERLSPNYFNSINPPGIKKWHGIRKKTTFPPSHEEALFIHELFAEHTIRSSTKKSEKSFRQFQIYALNGLQNLWNGASIRFSQQDMEKWPINYEDLECFYTKAEKLITVCGTKENIASLPDGHYIKPKPFRKSDILIIDAINKLGCPDTYAIPNRKAIETRKSKKNHCLSTGICTYGCPTNAMYKFSTKLLPEIEQLTNYTLILNAKVTRLIRSKNNNRIQSIEYIDTRTHRKNNIKATLFILCAGAIETPRILMNSHDNELLYGVSNSSQTVGQFLQDNPKVVLATSLYKLWFRNKPRDVGYGDLLLILGKTKLGNGDPFNFIGHSISAPPDIPYYLAKLRYCPKSLKSHFVKILFNSFVTVGLFCKGDLMASNRVTLSNDCDLFGVKQVDISYKSSIQTLEKIQRMADFGHKVLRRASATIISQDHSNDGTGIHYAGTCRMGMSAKEAVVDVDLKSFDHDNLYLCDGGVIPNLPDKHLTLTIMALAIRLAENITKQLKKY